MRSTVPFINIQFSLTSSPGVRAMVVPVLQMRKGKLRKDNQLAQVLTQLSVAERVPLCTLPNAGPNPCLTTHLVDEGGELVVEGLDLLLLLLSYPLEGGIDLQVEGGQEALVDSDLLDAPRARHHPTSKSVPTEGSPGPVAHASETQPVAGTPTAGPAAAVASADRDSLATPKAVEAPGPEAAPKAAPEALPALGHRDRAEAGPAAWEEAGRGSTEVPSASGLDGDR